MNLLLNFPRDLCNEICSYWIKQGTLGRLDIAMTEKKSRFLWLEQLLSKTLNCNNYYRGRCYRKDYMCWIFHRNIARSLLQVCDDCLNSHGLLLFPVNFQMILTLYATNNTCDISKIVNSCTNLTSLTYGNACDITELDPNILSHLKELNLRPSIKVLKQCVNYCKNLTKILIRYGLTTTSLDYIIQRNINLTNISVNGNNEGLELIFKYCKNVNSLTFWSFKDDPTSVLTKYQHTWTNYEYFNIDINGCSNRIILNNSKELTIRYSGTEYAGIFKCFKGLHKIKFRYLYASDYLFTELLAGSFETLQHVSVDRCEMSLEIMLQLLECPRLTRLDYDSDENILREALARNTTSKLEYIYIKNLFDVSLSDISNILNYQSKLKLLQLIMVHKNRLISKDQIMSTHPTIKNIEIDWFDSYCWNLQITL